jgi:hypothetical protein
MRTSLANLYYGCKTEGPSDDDTRRFLPKFMTALAVIDYRNVKSKY